MYIRNHESAMYAKSTKNSGSVIRFKGQYPTELYRWRSKAHAKINIMHASYRILI